MDEHPQEFLPLRQHLRPASRYIFVMMMRQGDGPVAPDWLARRLQTVPADNPRMQRSIRQHMRQLRADLATIAPEYEQEWLTRDRSGYRLNRENPHVRALMAEVQACLDDDVPWADFIGGR